MTKGKSKPINKNLKDHNSFRLTKGKVKKKKIKEELPGSFSLLKDSFKRLERHWKVTLGLVGVHLTLQLLFAFDVTLSEAQVLYSTFFLIVMSLSYIWLLREQEQKKPEVRVSSAVYQGPFQLIPFLLLLLLAVLQSIPFIFGGWLFNIVINGNIAIFYWEKLLFAGIWLALAIPTAYWLTTTLVSLVVVAIPGVRPLEAWRATKRVVQPQLSRIMWRLLMFFAALLVFMGLSMYFLLAQEQLTIALRFPTLANVLLLPVFWAYIFSLYTHLRKAA